MDTKSTITNKLTSCGWCGAFYGKCSECHTCHKCGYRFESSAPRATGFKTLTDINPRSQKLRGLKVLEEARYGAAGLGRGLQVLQVVAVMQSLEDLPKPEMASLPCGKVLPGFAFPASGLFVRPCPVTPRHGFVESRLCHDLADVTKVWNETVAADPDGEIMITSWVDADYNAIWTPGLLAVGPGHDGATSGKATVNLPLPTVNPIPASIRDKAGVKHAPYIEAVMEGTDRVVVTQLRDGPEMESSRPDYIPSEMIITRVIQTNGEDLLKWAEVVAEMGVGDCVYHPGGSMADHYSVHARSHGIPIVTTFLPKVGEMLIPTGGVVNPDPKAVLRGIMDGDRFVMDSQHDYEGLAAIALIGLHYSSVLVGDEGWWTGFGAAIMARLGSMALLGEARHELHRKGPKCQRGTVYAKARNRSLSRHRASLPTLINVFRYGTFDGNGMGGPAWARCGVALLPLFNSFRSLAIKQDQDSVGELMRAYNIAVNQAHNGGWWLNKFIGGDAFNDIPAGVPSHLLKSLAVIYKTGLLKAANHDTVAYIERLSKRSIVDMRCPRIQLAELEWVPEAGFMLNLTFNKTHHRTVRVDSHTIASSLMNKMGGVRIDGSTGLMKLVIASKDGNNEVLWTEPRIEALASMEGVNH